MNSKIGSLLIASLLFSTAPWAANRISLLKKSTPIQESMTLGITVGTDIGGAIPVPISAVGSQMEAVPTLQVSIGARASIHYTEHLTTILEVNYKQVQLEALARVTNQKATLEGIVQYFTGTVRSNMSFTMLEIPLLFKYKLNQGKHSLIAGGFATWLPTASFLNTPIKGFLGSEPNMVNPGGNIDAPNESTRMQFSSYLDNWDAGIAIGYENRIINQLYLTTRIFMGFNNIFKAGKNPLEYGMYQIRGSVSLTYDLFYLTRKK